MRTLRLFLFAAVALAAVGVGAALLPASAQTADDATPSGITVAGSGGVDTTPDRGVVSLGVESRGETARAAIAANAAEMRKVIAAIRGAGVAAADIQTQQVSLSRRFDQEGRETNGFVATNSVAVTVRDLDKAGAIIDAAVAAGANQVGGPSLLRGDQTDLYRRALRVAYADARAKAETLAAASGRSIGAVVSMQEQSGGVVLMSTAAGRAEDAGTPIEPGTSRIEATLTVTFALQ